MQIEERIAKLRAKAGRCRRLLPELSGLAGRRSLIQLAETYEQQADAIERQATGGKTPRFTRTAAE